MNTANKKTKCNKDKRKQNKIIVNKYVNKTNSNKLTSRILLDFNYYKVWLNC